LICQPRKPYLEPKMK